MSLHRNHFAKYLVVLLVVNQAVPLAQAVQPREIISRLIKPGHQHPVPPPMAQDRAVEELARNIDWLEKQIDKWGTVVAKAPDVWGEARLTAHRQEIEQELAKQLTRFDENRLTGAQFVSDQAMLAASLALRSEPALPTGRTTRVSAPQISVATNSTSTTNPAEGTTAAVGSTGLPTISSTTSLGTPGSLFGLSAQTALVGQTLKLEQTEVLDQLNRYLHHQAQLRRINEGDDTADAPGYSLNLVRVPVSILPGKNSKRGYGAEMTLTATPYLGPELLPMAYRDFVLNDLVDQLAIPLTRFLNGDRVEVRKLMEGMNSLEDEFQKIYDRRKCGTRVFDPKYLDPGSCKELEFHESDGYPKTSIRVTIDNLANYERDLACIEQSIQVKIRSDRRALVVVKNSPPGQNNTKAVNDAVTQLKWDPTNIPADETQRNNKITQTENEIAAADGARETIVCQLEGLKLQRGQILALQRQVDSLRNVTLPAGPSRRAILPFPATHLLDNYGIHQLAHIAKSAYVAFDADIVNRRIVHVTDVQSFLREELGAAWELLSTEQMYHWWEREADQQRPLYSMIRLRQTPEIQGYREEFIEGIGGTARHDVTASLAWCIFVESILLNERLIQDMRETAGTRPCACSVEGWLPFFGPNPPLEARTLFAEYVRCRWPIRVFALDPVVNEQNIADISSIYRQMQMAVVLAFSGGEIGLSAAMQAMRKLQRDRATIDLKRTAVAFGHGEDTFGWKFYPRFQTPPVEGNVTVLFRDLVWGGPTDRQLECSEEIEPGMRECLAIVLMPSFVPHVTVEARGNWFKLANPGDTAVSIADTVEFSRAVKSMQQLAIECVRCSHLYRDGEVDRLLARVHQLDRKLPLQTLPCQVPIENSLGGFEIFSSGTRELAPELQGWYGSPGYDRNRPTRLFFTGDNLSISQSRLIVGNEDIPFRLLSRQIMEVTLPAGLPFLRDENLYVKEENELYDGYLDAHVATPYGVSGHLLIPVVRETGLAGIPRVRANEERIVIVARHSSPATPGVPVVEKFEMTSLNAFRVDVSPHVGVNRGAVKLKFFPSAGSDRLKPVDIALVLPTNDGMAYELSAAQAIDQVQTSAGTLGESIKHYVDWLFKSGPPPTMLRVRIAVALEVDGRILPVEGQFVVDVELRKTGT